VDPIVVLFVVVCAVALVLVPRRWAPLPLIVGACYMTRGQALDVGAVSLTVVRLLIAAGFVRLLIRREWIRGGLNGLDALMVAWGVWMVASVAFHAAPDATLMVRVRDLYEAWGLYLLFRVFCQSRDDVKQLATVLAVVLAPIAVAMVVEKMTGVNGFSQFGGVPVFSTVRNGVVRAQGPFAHAILAGSIGGVCLPLVMGLWRDRRRLSILGIAGCVGIALASGSSGPLLTVAAGMGVWALWPMRTHMRLLRWTMALVYLGLEIVMNRPAYFLITDIDLMGGSTSWYRAELIHSSIVHFNEWWLTGTDYTRHWMPSGVMSGPNQTDITNHYIAMGVVGGLPLMCLFIAILIKGFRQVGIAMWSDPDDDRTIYCWSVGAALFAQAVTCLSVSYYDHSIMFLYLTLAATTATLFSDPVPVTAAAPRRAGAAVTAPAAIAPDAPIRPRWRPAADVRLAVQSYRRPSEADRRWVASRAWIPYGRARSSDLDRD
jgi:hypothetical protein